MRPERVGNVGDLDQYWLHLSVSDLQHGHTEGRGALKASPVGCVVSFLEAVLEREPGTAPSGSGRLRFAQRHMVRPLTHHRDSGTTFKFLQPSQSAGL